MSQDFVALWSWGAAGAERAERVAERCARAGLVPVVRQRALIVLARPGTARVMGDLIVFGELIGDPATAAATVRHDPHGAARCLVRDCWGAYVSILVGPDAVFVMADPSGAGRAHLCSDDELAMVTDALCPGLAACGGFSPRVRDDVLAGGLVDPPTLVAASALSGVEHLLPGVLVPLGASDTASVVWSPASTNRQLDADGRALVQAVDRAVGGLRGERPLVQTSGGLDSAIVLATAASQGPVLAFTAVGGAGDVDESRYARDAAGAAGVELVIADDVEMPRFSTFMDAPQFAHPFLHGLDEVFDRQIEAAVRRHRCDRILTGQGGDAVFLQPATVATTVDRYADLGPRGLFTGLLDDARRCRTSIWSPLVAVARNVVRRATAPLPPLLTPHLLHPDALRGARRMQHPWTLGRDAPHPGRLLQARLLANSLVAHTRRPCPAAVPMVSPLLSQPVLEAVLAIPTWRLATGPHDRGLARMLFAERLPSSIARRSIKGQASAYFSRAVVANLPVLRERLLDGRLAAARILDRDALERTLQREHLAHSIDYRSLMFVSSCEAWFAAWA